MIIIIKVTKKYRKWKKGEEYDAKEHHTPSNRYYV